MKKLKVCVGILAFMGLAVLNFTQSESGFISKSLASSDEGSSSTSDNSSSDDPNFVHSSKLSPKTCQLTVPNNSSEPIIVNGTTIAPGSSYVVLGTYMDCIFYLFSQCDQRLITTCQPIQ